MIDLFAKTKLIYYFHFQVNCNFFQSAYQVFIQTIQLAKPTPTGCCYIYELLLASNIIM